MTEPTILSTTPMNVTDIDLSITDKKPFRFGKDDNRIVYLNVSDMGVLQRIKDYYGKLQELQTKAAAITAGIDVENIDDKSGDELMTAATTVAERLSDIDAEMRACIDEMFQAPVSQAAAPDGSMFDPFNGALRFEIIIEALVAQYENNLTHEFNKMRAKLSKHTAKYTK